MKRCGEGYGVSGRGVQEASYKEKVENEQKKREIKEIKTEWKNTIMKNGN